MQMLISLLRKLVRTLFILWKRGVSGIVNLISGLWKALRTLSSTPRPPPEKDVAVDRAQQNVFLCASSTPSLRPFGDGPAYPDEHQVVRIDGTNVASNVINPGWASQELGSNSNRIPSTSTSEGIAYHLPHFQGLLLHLTTSSH